MSLTVRTLGGLAVLRDGRALESLPAQRLRCALLVYLGVSRETTREAATTLLWPDRDPERARHSLSQTLYELRQELGEDWLDSRGELLRVTPAVELDALRMESEAASGDLGSAVSRYRGPFLDGTELVDGSAWEGWVLGRRAHFARVHRQAHRELVERCLATGDLAGGLSEARAWADVDPLDDEAQHRLIQLLASAGEEAEAITRYEAYAGTLAGKGLEPLDETRALIEGVRGGSAVTGGRAPALSGPAGEDASATRPLTADRAWVPVLAVLAVTLLLTVSLVLLSSLSTTEGDGAGHMDPTRVAVLEFEDHRPSASTDPLASAFTEQLVRALEEWDDITVVPLGTVRGHSASLPLDSLARVLGAGLLVTGSIEASEGAVRVRLQLVDGSSGSLLRPFQVLHPWEDRLQLLDTLTAQSAAFVQRELGREVQLRRRRLGTRDDRAWALLLEGEEALREAAALRDMGHPSGAEPTFRELVRADSVLELAESLDPDWVEPPLLRGWLAVDAARVAELTSDDPIRAYEERMREGLAHAERALALRPQSAAGLELRGTLRFRLAVRLSGHRPVHDLLDLAQADLERARLVDERRAGAWATLSELYQLQGKYAQARRAAERALEADAFLEHADDVIHRLWSSAASMGDFDSALSGCRLGQSRFPEDPRFLGCERRLMAYSEVVPADLDSARALSRRELELWPETRRAEWLPRHEMELAGVVARLGMADSARALIRRARRHAAGMPDIQAWLNYDEAIVRLQLGEPRMAMGLIQELVALVPEAPEALARDRWLAPLRSDPAFKRLVLDP